MEGLRYRSLNTSCTSPLNPPRTTKTLPFQACINRNQHPKPDTLNPEKVVFSGFRHTLEFCSLPDQGLKARMLGSASRGVGFISPSSHPRHRALGLGWVEGSCLGSGFRRAVLFRHRPRLGHIAFRSCWGV